MCKSSFLTKGRAGGAAMLEFAIVVPVLLAVFFGIAELGRALLLQQQLVRNVEAGTRYLARTYQGLDTTDCSENGNWTAASVTAAQLTVYGSETGGATPVIAGMASDDLTISVAQRPVTGSDDACVVRMVATVAYPSLFAGPNIPILGVAQPSLSAASEERYVGE